MYRIEKATFAKWLFWFFCNINYLFIEDCV